MLPLRCGLLIMPWLLLTGCHGRTADDMVPSGETVRVVIPTDDIAPDSALAAGDIPE